MVGPKLITLLESICIVLMFHKAFIEHLIVGIKCMCIDFIMCGGFSTCFTQLLVIIFIDMVYVLFSDIFTKMQHLCAQLPNMYHMCNQMLNHPIFLINNNIIIQPPNCLPISLLWSIQICILFCLGALWASSVFFGEVGLLISELCFCSFWP
jgi:hypothetical protein